MGGEVDGAAHVLVIQIVAQVVQETQDADCCHACGERRGGKRHSSYDVLGIDDPPRGGHEAVELRGEGQISHARTREAIKRRVGGYSDGGDIGGDLAAATEADV